MARLGVVVILFCYIHISATKDESPKRCKKYGICDNTEDYPTELARNLIRELKAQNTIFNVEEAPEVPRIYFGLRSSFREDTYIQPLCETKRQSWSPKEAFNENNQRKMILNDDPPSQVFNVGFCPDSSEESDESEFCRTQTTSQGYEGKCIETTRLKEMYYIEGNRSKIGYFRIPTCCSCDLEKY